MVDKQELIEFKFDRFYIWSYIRPVGLIFEINIFCSGIDVDGDDNKNRRPQ